MLTWLHKLLGPTPAPPAPVLTDYQETLLAGIETFNGAVGARMLVAQANAENGTLRPGDARMLDRRAHAQSLEASLAELTGPHRRSGEVTVASAPTSVGRSTPSLVVPDTPLVFTGSMPSCFYPEEGGRVYRGNTRLKLRIDTRIRGMQPGERFKCLLTGTAGGGKTSLAWIIAQRIQTQQTLNGEAPGRFFQIMPGQIKTKAQLDTFVCQLQANDIVFIDEVHVLRDAVGADPLYHILADTGQPTYALGIEQGWVTLPPGISWLSATTNPGALDGTTGGALRRRFAPEFEVEPLDIDDLILVLEDQDPPVQRDAAVLLAERALGLPWYALDLYQEARACARSHDSSLVEDGHVEEAFTTIGMDEHGLLPADRRIIETILRARTVQASGKVVYRMRESALCAAVGVDAATYNDRILPKLLRLQLLTTSGGQTLTDQALAWYSPSSVP